MISIKRLSTGVCLGALLLAPLGTWAAGANAIADTYVSSTQPASNFGTASAINIGGGNTALIQFDLASLPAGLTAAQISKATMTFYVNTVLTGGSLDISQVTSAWTEATVNNNNRPTYFSPFALGVAAATARQYVTVDVTQLVQDWVTGSATNFGVQISAAAGAPTTSVVLDSKENQTTSHPAFLDVVIQSGGPTGPTGPAGAAGPTGPAGVAGVAGPTGPAGVAGVAGPTGPAGVAGVAGPTGPAGVAGVAGPTGPAGVAGVAGPTGPAGVAGAAGPTGPAGVAGVAGPTGPAGVAGVAGPTGPAGLTGPAGPTGPTGVAGGVGPTGPAGLTGPAGPTGPQGVQGVPGSTGPAGATGPAGTNGAGVFGASAINPGGVATLFYVPLNAFGAITNNNPEFTGMAMPVACTFNNLYFTAFGVTSPGQGFSATLVKNGVDQALTCSLTSVVGSQSKCSDTAHTFSVVQGDVVTVKFTQPGGTPIVRVAIGTRCI